jgi:hypothetical protein
MHLGSLLFWLGLFFPNIQAGLRAGAFFLWFAALLPMLMELYALAKAGTERMERASRRIVPSDTVHTD